LIGLLAVLGTAIGMLVAVVGLPYGRADFTAFADPYHGDPSAPVTDIHVVLDCDTSNGTEDALCNIPVTNVTDLVAGVQVHSETTASDIGSFQFNVVTPDETKMDAVASAEGNLDDNPDANDNEFVPFLAINDYACNASPPTEDDGSAGAGADSSRLICLSAGGMGPAINPGDEYVMGTVTYDDLVVAPTTNTLTLTKVQVNDNAINELGSCNPDIGTLISCIPTTYNFFEPTATFTPTNTSTSSPTNTPTETNTPTNTATFTPTNTATATPAGATMLKVPETCLIPNNDDQCTTEDPASPEQPHVNLFLCENGPCDGPAEGSLKVYEVVSNVQTQDNNFDTVQDGLGAYEFDVEYDNFVISSVNPCDIVFGPGGAGSTRGPVDEINTSSPANSDCTPDPNSGLDGTCTMSIILENVVHFGCVTSGPTPNGPTGSFTLSSLELVPHEDLVEDLFPGNDNGVVTKIKDNGCELADVFGHPVLGSVGGGLLPVCGNLSVTIRILEGDLDLDCEVDVTDAQVMAFRYGAFFGSLLYSIWYDLEPNFHDLDIDIKDVQKVFGREGSTCEDPIPAQTPVPFF
jgi:hypothetical protein